MIGCTCSRCQDEWRVVRFQGSRCADSAREVGNRGVTSSDVVYG